MLWRKAEIQFMWLLLVYFGLFIASLGVVAIILSCLKPCNGCSTVLRSTFKILSLELKTHHDLMPICYSRLSSSTVSVMILLLAEYLNFHFLYHVSCLCDSAGVVASASLPFTHVFYSFSKYLLSDYDTSDSVLGIVDWYVFNE